MCNEQKSYHRQWNMSKLLTTLGIMVTIFVIYMIEQTLPFRVLVYKVSLGWILVVIEFCLLLIVSRCLQKSDIKLRWKMSVQGLLFIVLIVWGVSIFLTDEFWGYNHHSSVIVSPNDSRTIVITDIGEWNGTTFYVYKKGCGIATLLYTKHSAVSFQTISCDCKWMKDKVLVQISGEDMEYESFEVQY